MKNDFMIMAMKIIGSIAIGLGFSFVVHKFILLNQEVNAYGFPLVVLYVIFLLIPALCVTIAVSVVKVVSNNPGSRIALVSLWIPAVLVIVYDITQPYFKDRQIQQFAKEKVNKVTERHVNLSGRNIWLNPYEYRQIGVSHIKPLGDSEVYIDGVDETPSLDPIFVNRYSSDHRLLPKATVNFRYGSSDSANDEPLKAWPIKAPSYEKFASLLKNPYWDEFYFSKFPVSYNYYYYSDRIEVDASFDPYYATRFPQISWEKIHIINFGKIDVSRVSINGWSMDGKVLPGSDCHVQGLVKFPNTLLGPLYIRWQDAKNGEWQTETIDSIPNKPDAYPDGSIDQSEPVAYLDQELVLTINPTGQRPQLSYEKTKDEEAVIASCPAPSGAH